MLDRILANGYFPKEIPPCFAGSSFAAWATTSQGIAAEAAMPANFNSRPLRHSHARVGGHRRPLSIPHPLNYWRLAREIDGSWASDISPFLTTISYGASRPYPSQGPRAFRESATQDIVAQKMLARAGMRYVLKVDIQNFYPSIYTHSIPWALHTKAVAKANQFNAALAGNRLDVAARNGQHKQTVGIPIGPDSSWVIAEIVLAAIEKDLRTRVGSMPVYRYLDDFEFSCRSLGEADEALAAFEQSLAEFELSPNPRKTRTIALPAPLDDPGINELRTWEFRGTPRAQRIDVAGYFDRTFALCSENPNGHWASYALSRIAHEQLQQASWELAEAAILQLIASEPSCARYGATALAKARSRGRTIRSALLSEATETIARRHISLGNGSELAWMLWMCIEHSAQIPAWVCSRIGDMEDSLVALLALYARSYSLAAAPIATHRWEQMMDVAYLDSEHWLLSYEARVRGWLPSLSIANHLAGHAFYGPMQTAGVSFLTFPQTGAATLTPATYAASLMFGPTASITP